MAASGMSEPYGVIDLNAGVDFGRFDLEAYVKNLGNSRWRHVESPGPDNARLPERSDRNRYHPPKNRWARHSASITKGDRTMRLICLARCDRGGGRHSGERPVADAACSRPKPTRRGASAARQPSDIGNGGTAAHDLTKADVDAWLDGYHALCAQGRRHSGRGRRGRQGRPAADRCAASAIPT